MFSHLYLCLVVTQTGEPFPPNTLNVNLDFHLIKKKGFLIKRQLDNLSVLPEALLRC